MAGSPVKGLAAAGVTTAIAAASAPAAAGAVLITVIMAAMICWILANPHRSRRAAELLRAAHGKPPGNAPAGRLMGRGRRLR
jgi:hypothetical protein